MRSLPVNPISFPFGFRSSRLDLHRSYLPSFRRRAGVTFVK